MEETLNQINKRLEKLEKSIDQLPKVIEFIVAELLDRYVVEPDDFEVNIQALQSSICDISTIQTPKKTPSKSAKKAQSMRGSGTPKKLQASKFKEESSSDSSDDEQHGEWKIVDGPTKVVGQLSEYTENFTVQNDALIVCTPTAITNTTEGKVLAELENKQINDVNITKKGKILISTNDDLIISHNGILNTQEGKMTSSCEFNGQIVGVSDKGLRCKHHGREGYIKHLTQKIQLNDPVKVRASEKRLFINDRGTNIMSILDENFKIIKAINSSKIPDFCVISDDQFATISSKGIKIVTFDAQNLNVDRYVKVEVDGTPIELIKIDYVTTKTEQFILGLGKDKLTTYKIPIKARN